MSELIIVAQIVAKPEAVDTVKAALQALIQPTLAEAGCHQYDLHQDNQTPTHFLFYERWQTRELWQAHMKSPHLKAFQTDTEGLVNSVTIFEMNKMDVASHSV